MTKFKHSLKEEDVRKEILCVVTALLQPYQAHYLWVAVGLFGEQDKIKWEFWANKKNEKCKRLPDKFDDLQLATVRSKASLANNLKELFQSGCANLPYIWTKVDTFSKSTCTTGLCGAFVIAPRAISNGGVKFAEVLKRYYLGHECVAIPIVLWSGGVPRMVGVIVLCCRVDNPHIIQLLPLIKSQAIALMEPHRNLYGLFPERSVNVAILMLRPWLYNYKPFLFEGAHHDLESSKRLEEAREILQKVDPKMRDKKTEEQWMSATSAAKSLYGCFSDGGEATNDTLQENKLKSSSYHVSQQQFKSLWEVYDMHAATLLHFEGKVDVIEWPSKPGILGFLSLMRIYDALSGNLESSAMRRRSPQYIEKIVIGRNEKGKSYNCTFCYRPDIVLDTHDNLDVLELRKRWWQHILGTRDGGAVVKHVLDASKLKFTDWENAFRLDRKAQANPLFAGFFSGVRRPCYDFSFGENQVSLSWQFAVKEKNPKSKGIAKRAVKLGFFNHDFDCPPDKNTIGAAAQLSDIECAYLDEEQLHYFPDKCDIFLAHNTHILQEINKKEASEETLSLVDRSIVILFSTVESTKPPKLFKCNNRMCYAVFIQKSLKREPLAWRHWLPLLEWAKTLLLAKTWSKTEIEAQMPEGVKTLLGIKNLLEFVASEIKTIKPLTNADRDKLVNAIKERGEELSCDTASVQVIEQACGLTARKFERTASSGQNNHIVCLFYTGTVGELKDIVRLRHALGVPNIVLVVINGDLLVSRNPVFKYLDIPGAPRCVDLSKEGFCGLIDAILNPSLELPAESVLRKYFENIYTEISANVSEANHPAVLKAADSGLSMLRNIHTITPEAIEALLGLF